MARQRRFPPRSLVVGGTSCAVSWASRRAVHAHEHQGGSGGHRSSVRRRAGPGVPRGDQGARAREIRPDLPARPARLSLSVRPQHKTQEEVYVVLHGSGRMRLTTRSSTSRNGTRCEFPPGTWRGYEAGPDGLEILVIGAPGTPCRTRARMSRAGATGGVTSSAPLGRDG